MKSALSIKKSAMIFFIVTINILDEDIIPNIHTICADRLTKITWATEGSTRSRIVGWKLTQRERDGKRGKQRGGGDVQRWWHGRRG